MADISVDFDTHRLSVLRKAINISSSINSTTLGPNSSPTPAANPQNRENNKNTVNISLPKPSKSPSPRPKTSTTFSIEKILHENEIQRREDVRKAVDKHKQRMEAFEQKLQSEIATIRVELAEKRERELADERARKEAEEAHFAQQDEIKRRHEAQLLVQRVQERKEKLEREADEHRRLKEHEDCLEIINSCKVRFSDKCREIAQLAESINNRNLIGEVVGPFTSRLRDMKRYFDRISEVKNGELGRNNVSLAENIVREVDEIFGIFRSEVDRVSDECLRREADAQAIARAQAAVTEQGQSGQADGGSEGVNNVAVSEESPGHPEGEVKSVDVDSIQVYLNSKNFLEQYRMSYREFLDVDPNGTYRTSCEKSLNILVKKISPMGGGFLRDIIKDFQRRFEGKGPQELAFCKNFVAETLVDEVDCIPPQNPKRIYAVAAVAVALWYHYPDFGDLLISHLHIKCPYTIPVVLPRFQGQTQEEFSSTRGYNYENGVREDDKLFYPRMETLMRFYGAIIITKLPKSIIKNHPHGLGNAWKWLAIILNFQPQHDAVEIYPRVMKAFLEVVGDSMFKSYPNQFPKLLKLISEDYYKILVNYGGDNNFAISPFNQFLSETIIKNNRGEIVNVKPIPPPVGQLPPNFW